MATLAVSAQPKLRFKWIINRNNDLIWYIGSVLAGWLYVAVILALAGQTHGNVLDDTIGAINLGTIQIAITLRLLVITSWSWLIDSPHVFATLARTFIDPDERTVRSGLLRRSWLLFLFGPVFISAPYLIGALLEPLGVHLSEFVLNLGWLVYFVFFRLWAYFHVVRQHWGFFSLYKRRGEDMADARENKIDGWFFNIVFYVPLLMFMTSTFYGQSPGYPDLGLRAPIVGAISIGAVLYPILWAIYLSSILAYVLWQINRWRTGRVVNGSKLLLLLAYAPMHFVAMSNPILVIFLLPLITVGHNLQYHRIVWSYGHTKYTKEERPGFKLARKIFSSVPLYILVGLLFSFALYTGPLVDTIHTITGLQLDKTLLNGLSMMAGIVDPSKLALGDKIFAAFLSGWALQHYYIDGQIWKVRKDKMVQKNLNI